MRHHDIQLTGSVAVTGSFTVPVGTTDERPSNPKSGSLRLNTTLLGVAEIYNGNEWVTVGEQTASPASADIEYLVVAGGGGGGGTIAGGGGAGGYLSSSLSSMNSGSTITVTVGGGGTGGYGWTVQTPATDGGDSTLVSAGGTSFTTVTAIGGGKGGDHAGNSTSNNQPGGGGSGGGGGRYSSYTGQGGSGTVGQGSDGGDQPNSTVADNSGAGGGGAGAAGDDNSASYDADGGIGKQSKITGTLTYYAGGGGAGTRGSATTDFGEGGSGGGGNGNSGNVASSGTTNTGGGGGGGGYASSVSTKTGGDGGSGVVVLAYNSGSINAVGGITGDAGNGRRYHQFNTGGTFKVGSNDDLKIVDSNLVLHLDAGNYASRGASTWSDLTANGYNATLVSSPALGQNFYYDFDGSADYGTFASAAHTALFGQTQGTIEAWVNGDTFTSGTARKTIFGTGHSSQTDRWCVMRVTSTNYLQMSITNDGTNYGCNVTTSLPSTSTWYHFAITYDGSSFAAYYDGVSQTINTTAAGWFNNVASDTLQVGAMDRGTSGNNYDPWNGKIAQVRVYSSALTAAQVLQNYNATKTNFS